MKILNGMKLGGMLVATAFLGNCGNKPDTSDLDYGILDGHDQWGQQFTIDVPPGDQTVYICGSNQYGMIDLAQEDFYDWAAKIGRTNIQVVTEEKNSDSCRQGSHFWMIKTVVDTSCPAGVLGWNQSSGRSNTIALCEGSYGTRGQMLQDTMLHEVGHSWGMCDQYYSGSNGFDPQRHHDNCDDILRSDEATDSIMNAGGAPKAAENEGIITHDDVTGIRVAACLNRDANQAWMNQNPSLIAQWRQDPYFISELEAIYQRDPNALLPECLEDSTVSDEDQNGTDDSVDEDSGTSEPETPQPEEPTEPEPELIDCNLFSLVTSRTWFVVKFGIAGPVEEVDYAIYKIGRGSYQVAGGNLEIYSLYGNAEVDLYFPSGQICRNVQ